MKDFLGFLIARDTMHQQQWLAVIEELEGLEKCLLIPNSFPQEKEASAFFYVFLGTKKDGSPPQGRFDSRAIPRWPGRLHRGHGAAARTAGRRRNRCKQ